jgi:hypothetical protein
MRLPFVRRSAALELNAFELPVLTDHPGPQPAFRVLGQSPDGNPDPWEWSRVDPCERVRVIPRDDPPFAAVDVPGAGAVRDAVPARVVSVGDRRDEVARAGYRWGSEAARSGCDLPDPEIDASVADLAPAPSPAAGANLPAVRYERAVLAVAARTEVLASSLERLETTVTHLSDMLFDAATQSDLIELEARRARLAAEVCRLSIELRAEFDRRLHELSRALAKVGPRTPALEFRGPLDLADARRVELHLESDTDAPSLASAG